MEREDRYDELVNILAKDQTLPDVLVVSDRATLKGTGRKRSYGRSERSIRELCNARENQRRCLRVMEAVFWISVTI